MNTWNYISSICHWKKLYSLGIFSETKDLEFILSEQLIRFFPHYILMDLAKSKSLADTSQIETAICGVYFMYLHLLL